MDAEEWLKINIASLNAAIERKSAILDARQFLLDIRISHREWSENDVSD